MGTITRTATIQALDADVGIVSLASPSTYAYILTPTDPELSFSAGAKGNPDITKLSWFQFNFNSLGDSIYDNVYIATNINAVSVVNFKYDVVFVSGTDGSTKFGPIINLPNSAISIPSAQAVFDSILSGGAAGSTYSSVVRTVGAQTADLDEDASSTVLTSTKSAIQSIENNHDSDTSDNGKWAFGGKTTVTVAANTRFDRNDSTLTNGFFLDITYTVTIAAPALAVVYSGDQATILIASSLLDSTQTQWEFTEVKGTFTVETESIGTATSTSIQIDASSLGSVTITAEPVLDYTVRARQHVNGEWHDWSSSISVEFQFESFNDIIPASDLTDYASRLGEIARAGNSSAGSIINAIDTITAVDVTTFDFFENAAQNISSLRNAFQEAHTQMTASAQSIEPLRGSFTELYDHINKFSGLTLDAYLTNNGLQVDSTFAAVSARFGQTISTANISS